MADAEEPAGEVTASQAVLIETAAELQEALRLRRATLLIPSIILLAVSIYWDKFYAGYEIYFPDVGFAQYWIIHLCFTSYIMSAGIATFIWLEYVRCEILTYFITTEQITSFRKIMDGVAGFFVVFFLLPFWLTVREGTLQCFIGRDCDNWFGILYLGCVDALCGTESLPIYTPNTLPKCENIFYLIPIVSFTMLPIYYASCLYNSYYAAIASGHLPSSLTRKEPLPLTGSFISRCRRAYQERRRIYYENMAEDEQYSDADDWVEDNNDNEPTILSTIPPAQITWSESSEGLDNNNEPTLLCIKPPVQVSSDESITSIFENPEDEPEIVIVSAQARMEVLEDISSSESLFGTRL